MKFYNKGLWVVNTLGYLNLQKLGMIYSLPHIVVFILYFISLLLAHALGVWISNRNSFSLERSNNTMLIEGTLLSLLIGFTFNTAFDKYSSRKRVITDEINSIFTTKSLVATLPAESRDSLTRDIQRYIQTRIAYFEAGENEAQINKELAKADILYQSLLNQAGYLSRKPEFAILSRELLHSISTMSDLAATREMLRQARVPLPVMKLLILISWLVAFLNGANSSYKKTDWFKGAGYALLIAITLYLILDLDTTRKGYITLQEQEESLKALLQTNDK